MAHGGSGGNGGGRPPVLNGDPPIRVRVRVRVRVRPPGLRNDDPLGIGFVFPGGTKSTGTKTPTQQLRLYYACVEMAVRFRVDSLENTPNHLYRHKSSFATSHYHLSHSNLTICRHDDPEEP